MVEMDWIINSEMPVRMLRVGQINLQGSAACLDDFVQTIRDRN